MILLKTLMFMLLISTRPAFSESVQGSVVTRVEGEATLMIKKSAAPQPSNTRTVQLESETYYVRDVKRGDRPGNGDVISTGKDGKVRLIFRNGDQVTVTPGTAYKFSWEKKSDLGPVAQILYGDIRAVIQPGGPRSGMDVKTKAVAMGVRGTDFYASAWSREGGSKVVVLRGKVAVASVGDAGVKGPETIVDVGRTGIVKPLPSQGATPSATNNPQQIPAAIEVTASTKQELVVIQQDSKVQRAESSGATTAGPLEQQLKSLEKQATKATLSDLKTYDPEAYKELVEKHGADKDFDGDVIQANTVKKLFVQAPSAPAEEKKPTLQDLETGGDVYEKYKWKQK